MSLEQQRPPLWEVMCESFWRCPKENWRLSCAYMIRAVRDWLKMQLPEGGAWYALLTAEAERAEVGG